MWPITADEIFKSLDKMILNQENVSLETWKNVLIEGACFDSRKINPNEIFFAIPGEKVDGHDFVVSCLEKNANLVVVNSKWKGVHSLSAKFKEKCVIVNDTLEAARKLAAMFRSRFPFPVIGIGGSNGKTSTKELLSACLSGANQKICKTDKSENGYLGLAVTLLQNNISKKSLPDALVLEIGIDEIGAMEKHVNLAKPNVVLLTSIGEEHLEGLKNIETVLTEELKLFETNDCSRVWQFADPLIRSQYSKFAGSKDIVVIQCQHAEFEEMVTHNHLSLIQNKLSKEEESLANQILIWCIEKETPSGTRIKVAALASKDKSIKLSDKCDEDFFLPLMGQHYCANFALAIGTSYFYFKRSFFEIHEGLKSFTPPPMRSRISELANSTTLINDCYNANPLSMRAAIALLKSQQWEKKKKILILGDMLDLGESSKKCHQDLAIELVTLNPDLLCLYGNAMYDCYQNIKQISGAEKISNIQLLWLPETNEPDEFLNQEKNCFYEAVILVKGSRGMRMERVISKIQTMLSS